MPRERIIETSVDAEETAVTESGPETGTETVLGEVRSLVSHRPSHRVVM